MLANKYVSVKVRLWLFDEVVTPTVLFRMVTMALTQSELERLDARQKRILRLIVGRVGIQSEEWRMTMSRTRPHI